MPNKLTSNKNLQLKLSVILAALAAALVAFVVGSTQVADGKDAQKQDAKTPFSVLVPVDGNALDGLSSESKLLLSMSESDGELSGVSSMGRVTSSSGNDIAVIERGDKICIVETTHGLSNCGDSTAVQAGNLYVAAPESCSTVRILGLVPDGVDALSVEQPGQAGASVRVESNVYDAVLPARSTTLASADGAVGFSIPLDSFASMSGPC